MGKCHICRKGKVDGGFAQRNKRELLELEAEKIKEVDKVVNKDKEKEKQMKKVVRDDYNKKLEEKTNEIAERISYCVYCKGTGFKGSALE